MPIVAQKSYSWNPVVCSDFCCVFSGGISNPVCMWIIFHIWHTKKPILTTEHGAYHQLLDQSKFYTSRYLSLSYYFDYNNVVLPNLWRKKTYQEMDKDPEQWEGWIFLQDFKKPEYEDRVSRMWMFMTLGKNMWISC